MPGRALNRLLVPVAGVRLRRVLLLAAVWLACGSGPGIASAQTWTSTSGSTTNSFNAAANWSNGAVPNSGAAVASFTNTLAGIAQTVDLQSSVTLNQLNFSTTSYTFANSTANGAGITLNNLTFTGVAAANTNLTQDLSAIGLTFASATSTLAIVGSNVANASVLRLGTVTVDNGASLVITRSLIGNQNQNRVITITQGGTFTANGNVAIQQLFGNATSTNGTLNVNFGTFLSSGNLTISGGGAATNVTISSFAGSGAINVYNAGTVVTISDYGGSGNLNLFGGTVSVNGFNSNANLNISGGLLTLSGSWSGTGGISFTGGTLRFSPNAGALNVSKQLAILSAPGSGIEIRANGAASNTLTFSGNISNDAATAGLRTISLGGGNPGVNLLSSTLTDGAAGNTLGVIRDGATSGSATGGALWYLSGANAFSGGISIRSGTLAVSSTAGLGSSNNIITFGNTVTDTAGVLLLGDVPTAASSVTLTNTFRLTGTDVGGAIFRNNSAGSGTLSIDAAATFAITTTAARLISFGGTNTGLNQVATVLADDISGTQLSIAKIEAGTWIISGSNHFSGASTLGAGTLIVTNTYSLGTAAWSIGTATLSTTGVDPFTLNNNLTLLGALTLSGGTSVTLGGNITVSGAIRTFTNQNTAGPNALAGTIFLGAAGTTTDLIFSGAASSTLLINGTITSGTGATGGSVGYTTGNFQVSGANGYAGFTTINGANVRLGNNLAFGSSTINATGGSLSTGASDVTLTNAAFNLLGANRTFTFGGTGALTLSNNTLAISATSATLFFNNTAGVTLNNLTLNDTNTNPGVLTLAGSGPLTVLGTISQVSTTAYNVNITNISAGGVTFKNLPNYAGATTIGAGATLKLDIATDYTYTGVLSGPGSVVLNPNSAVLVTFTSAQLYTGVTSVVSGTLQLGNGSSVGSVAGNIVNAGVVSFNPGSAISYSGSLSGNGAVLINSGAVTFSGVGSYTGVTTIASGATLQIGAGATGGVTGPIFNSGSLIFGRSNAYANGSAVAGSGTLQVTGGGSVTLTGDLQYTGATTIANGTLQLTGSAAAGYITNNIGNLALVVGGAGQSSILQLAGTVTRSFGTGTNQMQLAGTGGTVGFAATTSALTLSVGPSTWGSTDFLSDPTLAFALSSTTATAITELVGNLELSGAVSRTLLVVDNAASTADRARINGSVTSAAGGTLVKTGSGVLEITGNANTANWQVSGGAIRFAPSAITSGGIAFSGGILETQGALQLQIGLTAGAFRWAATNTDGGFAAVGGPLTVQLETNANFSTIDTIAWGNNAAQSTTGFLIGAAGNLILSSTNADSQVTLLNPLNFIANIVHEVEVFDNPNSSSDRAVLSGTISGAGTFTKSGDGLLVLTGTNTFNGANLRINGGTLQIGDGGAVGTLASATPAVTITGGAILQFNRSNTLTVANAIGGAGSIAQIGGGTLVLSGASTYTGATTVGGGALLVTGTLGNTAVSVANGATLAGSGTIAGSVTTSGALSGGLAIVGQATAQLAGVITPGGDGAVGTLTLGSLILNGGSLNFDLGIVGDQIAITGGAAPIFNSLTNLNLTSVAGFGAGTYQLISGYTGFLTTTDFANISATTVLGSFNLSLANADGALNLIVSSAVSTTNLVWTGATNSVWDASSINWDGGGATAFSNTGNTVSFDNSTNITNISITNAGVAPQRMTVNNDSAHDYLFSGGAITATEGLLKLGVGALTFEADASFGGGVTISGGTLRIGNGSTTGSLTGDVANSGLLVFDRTGSVTYSGAVSGSGTLAVTGAGTLIVTGNNTYTGVTTVNSGSTLVVGGANGNISGNIVNQGVLTLDRTLSYTGSITGNGVVLINSGTVTFSTAQTYAGVTTIAPGATLQIGSQTTGSIAGPIVNRGLLVFARTNASANGSTISGDGTLRITNGGTLTLTGDLQLTGNIEISNGILRLSGSAAAGFFNQNTGNLAWTVGAAGQTSILQVSGVLNRALGAGAGQLLLSGTGGTVGVSAFDSDLHWQLGSVVWGSAGFLDEPSLSLALSSTTAAALTELVGNLELSGSLTRTIFVADNTASTNDYALISGNVTSAAGGALVKTGLDVLEITGTANTAGWIINAGAIRATTTAVTSGSIVFNGGIVESRGDLKRNLGLTAGALSWSNANNISGGFAAVDGPLTVQLDTDANLSTIDTLTWGNSAAQSTTGFIQTGGALILGSTNANNRVMFLNNITSANPGQVREFRVIDNPNSSSDEAVISGSLSGVVQFSKTGAGLLILTGANVSTGTFHILAGTLQVGDGGALGTLAGGTAPIRNGAVLQFNRNDTLTVANSISNSGSLRQMGSGTTILSGNSSFTGATIVQAGTLLVTGTLGNTPASVAAGATLGGNGTLGGTVDNTGSLIGDLKITNVVTNRVGGLIAPGGLGTVGALTLGGLVLNGGSLNFDLDGLLTSDAIVISGGAFNVTASAGLNFNALSGLGAGTYNLISGYTGAIAGFGFLSSPTTLSNYALTLTDNSGVLQLLVSLSGGPPPGPNDLVWTGAVTGTWSTTSANWTGSNTIYADGDRVLFNDTSAVNTLTIAGSVMPGSITVDTAATYAIYGGPLTGTADLLKQGTGTLVLAGGHVFTGPTTVAGGTLQLGGDFASNIALQNATLQFSTTGNQTITGLISGSGFLQKLGGGTTTLVAQNTFSGITSVDAGTLVVNHALSGTVFVNAGGAFSGSGSSLSHVIVQGGSGNITGTQQGALEISGGSVTVQSGGATTGTVTIDSGTLTALSGAQIGNTLGIQVNGGTLDVQSGAQVVGNGQINVSGSLRADGRVQGLVVVENGGLVSGNGSVGSMIVQSGGTLSVGHSVGTLTLDGGPLGSSAAGLTLNAGANLVFEFNNALGTTGASGGNGGWDYIELGAGTLTINPTNYSATDRINLHIDSLTLLGNTHGTADNFDASPGTIGNITTYYWKFIGVELANIQLNPGDITTSSSLNGRFNIIDDAAGAGVFYDDGIANGNPFSRPVSHLGQGTFKVLAGSFGQGEGVYIYYSAVPEPGSMLLCALGAGGYYWRRRKQKTAQAPSVNPEPPSA